MDEVEGIQSWCTVLEFGLSLTSRAFSVTWSYPVPYLLRVVLRSKPKNYMGDACLCLKHLTESVPIVKANV